MVTEQDQPRTRKLDLELTDAEMFQLRAVASWKLMSRNELLAHLVREAIRDFEAKVKKEPQS